MQIITSKDNKLVKHIIKLKEKKYRKEYNEFIVEGVKIVQEAIEEKATIKQIIVSEEALEDNLIKNHLREYLRNTEYIKVPSNIFKILSEVEKPQGILAVIEKDSVNSNIDYSQDIILALDDIQDPGNLGTIIRTADAVGLNQILVSKGTADLYNSKVIRSTMGAIFRVNVIECENLAETLKDAKDNDYQVMITSLKESKSMYDVDLKKKIIVMGNEANGVSQRIENIADEKIIIPMIGKTESLNVSVATSVILYEYVRRKYSK